MGCWTMVSLHRRTLSSMQHAYSTSYSTRPVHTLRYTNKLPTTKSLVVLSAALHTFGKTLIHSTAHADSTICFGKQVWFLQQYRRQMDPTLSLPVQTILIAILGLRSVHPARSIAPSGIDLKGRRHASRASRAAMEAFYRLA